MHKKMHTYNAVVRSAMLLCVLSIAGIWSCSGKKTEERRQTETVRYNQKLASAI